MDEQVSSITKSITRGMQAVDPKLQQYVENWNKLKHIWEGLFIG